MKRTIALKLAINEEEASFLSATQCAFAKVCNGIVSFAKKNRCWNRVALHNLCYTKMREEVPEIGSQMVCNAIGKVCASYKALKIKKSEDVPLIQFSEAGSIHYCARTFSMKDSTISLYTVNGRLRCPFKIGDHQAKYLKNGEIREGELVKKGKRWFLNLVLDILDTPKLKKKTVLAVDVGENNLATTSNATIHGGGKLRHVRDKFLNRRRKLQSNGSKSAKHCLKKISGKERRRVKETNHVTSKKIVEEAVGSGAGVIVLEKLTNIRKRIKGNKRMRTRLHRWSWYELQQFVEYKAESAGIEVVYVNPSYTSVTCSKCGSFGNRNRHFFKCSSCGGSQHSDRNAAINLLKLGGSVVPSTAHLSTCRW